MAGQSSHEAFVAAAHPRCTLDDSSFIPTPNRPSGALRPGRLVAVCTRRSKLLAIVLGLAVPAVVLAQTPSGDSAQQTSNGQAAPASTRQAAIEQEQAQKATNLHPYVLNKGERIFERLDGIVERRTLKWHPFLQNAYSGGGFALGVGRAIYVSPYNYSMCAEAIRLRGYKRAEVEFVAPRMFQPAWRADGPRRLARGDASWFLRPWSRHIGRRSHELSFSSSRTARRSSRSIRLGDS